MAKLKPLVLILAFFLADQISFCHLYQRDPLGPLLFSIVTHPFVKSLSSELNLWYLDDGTPGDAPDSVLDDLRKIIIEAEKLGLSLNIPKCQAFVFGGSADEQKEATVTIRNEFEMKLLSGKDFCLLGSAVTDAVPDLIEKKVADLKRMTSRLPLLPSSVFSFEELLSFTATHLSTAY